MRRATLTLALLLAPVAVAAQAPDTALATRVRSLEELVRLLRQQLAEQAGAVVVPREGYRVELGGTLVFNGYHNTANANGRDVPQTASPVDAGLPPGGTGATARQSRLQVFALAPRVIGAAVTGELDVDFFGDADPSVPGRSFPFPRLRRMRADLVWSHAAVMVGQEAPLIAELNPASLAAVGLPEFASSGNLWLWIPQVRAGVSMGRVVRVGLDVAALTPSALPPDDQTLGDRAERSGRPFVQARAFARWGDPENASELGVGGHLGWIARGTDSLVTSRAAVGSLLLNLTAIADLRGEVFVGEALGLLGGGGVGQTLSPAGTPVDTRGGWVQVNVRPHPVLELGVAAGLDDPDDADLDPANGILENRTFTGHLTVRPRPLVFGVAVRRVGTSFFQPAVRAWNTHLNLVMGLVF
jgi:hypothetical protein